VSLRIVQIGRSPQTVKAQNKKSDKKSKKKVRKKAKGKAKEAQKIRADSLTCRPPITARAEKNTL